MQTRDTALNHIASVLNFKDFKRIISICPRLWLIANRDKSILIDKYKQFQKNIYLYSILNRENTKDSLNFIVDLRIEPNFIVDIEIVYLNLQIFVIKIGDKFTREIETNKNFIKLSNSLQPLGFKKIYDKGLIKGNTPQIKFFKIFGDIKFFEDIRKSLFILESKYSMIVRDVC